MRYRTGNVVVFCVGLALLGAMLYLYYRYDPMVHAWFPKCPFKALTGLSCPGCGSQRAIHALLHGRIGEAAQQNALILPFAPYLLAGFLFRCVQHPSVFLLRWRKILYGEWAIKVVSIVILGYFVMRNWP
ncbi:DUF2752 domain-containing protein [Sphingobacterium griseoflavum]|uniref:DUF2752 domain-containing protein n=1 Tax=Sphingobacterium griseoflavum TaxID=1474952 RepID=UPI0016733BF3|nr:DUF2752 domain-containing protein [Sphingobacterium griseoflavum]